MENEHKKGEFSKENILEQNDNSLIEEIICGLKKSKNPKPKLRIIKIKSNENSGKKNQRILSNTSIKNNPAYDLDFSLEDLYKLMNHFDSIRTKNINNRIVSDFSRGFQSGQNIEKQENTKLIKNTEEDDKYTSKISSWLNISVSKEPKIFPSELFVNPRQNGCQKHCPAINYTKSNNKEILIKIRFKEEIKYYFIANISRKSILIIDKIRLKEILDNEKKMNLLHNLIYYNEKGLLRAFLNMNIVCCFNEVGEVTTGAKKLNFSLSKNRIGIQFFCMSNKCFSKKILLLFHRESFPFKNFLDHREFYIVKFDHEIFLYRYYHKNFIIETDRKTQNSQTISSMEINQNFFLHHKLHKHGKNSTQELVDNDVSLYFGISNINCIKYHRPGANHAISERECDKNIYNKKNNTDYKQKNNLPFVQKDCHHINSFLSSNPKLNINESRIPNKLENLVSEPFYVSNFSNCCESKIRVNLKSLFKEGSKENVFEKKNHINDDGRSSTENNKNCNILNSNTASLITFKEIKGNNVSRMQSFSSMISNSNQEEEYDINQIYSNC